MKVGKKEIAKFQLREQRVFDGHVANDLDLARLGWVKDKKTGEMYDPNAKFDELMNRPEIMGAMKRLKIR